MSKYSVYNNRVEFEISIKKEIDIDALNLLVSEREQLLCKADYSNSEKKHCLTYSTEGLVDLNKSMETFNENDYRGLLYNIRLLVDVIKRNDLSCDNFLMDKETVLLYNNNYKFIYIPHNKSKRADNNIERWLVKVLFSFDKKNELIKNAVTEIKKSISEDGALFILEKYGHNPYVNQMTYTEETEGQTTLLSQEPMVQPEYTEGETTLLSQEPIEQYGYTEGETTLLSQEPMGQPEYTEGETTLLSQEPIEQYGYTEGETTLLSQEPIEQYGYTESETTLLSAQPMEPEYMDGEATVLLEESEYTEGETTLLSAQAEEPLPDMKLIRVVSGEVTSVTKNYFLIGKDPDKMDYVLHSSGVSRTHATIIYEAGMFYIQDNNSTNGTIVEGIRLAPYEKTELYDGSIVLLGNESIQISIGRG